jgi:hypothetical protein
MLPHDTSVEAEYKDGYIHSETEHDDVSPYATTNNILRDIIEKRPEAEHGPMVRFSCFYGNNRYDIDWRGMPDNARPIRFKHMEQDSVNGVITETRCVGLDFGYQATIDGKNVKEVSEIL